MLADAAVLHKTDDGLIVFPFDAMSMFMLAAE
jgi:hypothetical protein